MSIMSIDLKVKWWLKPFFWVITSFFGMEEDTMRRRRHPWGYVWMCYCIRCPAFMSSAPPHAEHSRHSWAAVWFHHGNTSRTVFTPLYGAGKHGNQSKNACVRSVWDWERKDYILWLPFAVTQRQTASLKNLDYFLSVESTKTVVPLWTPLLPVGSFWVSQWRPLDSPLL